MIELLSVTIPILGAIFFVAYREYIIFKNYVKYLYFLALSFLIFTLGWNLSLNYSEIQSPKIIEWKYFITVFISLIVIRIFSFIGKVHHHGNHLVEHEW